MIVDVCRTLLGDEGYPVETFGSGRDLLERARLRPGCVLLTGMNMPVMGGHGLLRELAHLPSGITARVSPARARSPRAAARPRASPMGYVVPKFPLGDRVAGIGPGVRIPAAGSSSQPRFSGYLNFFSIFSATRR